MSGMRAVIIRRSGAEHGVDFERLERELIAPALRRLDIDSGGAAMGDAGALSEAQIQLLERADVIIAAPTFSDRDDAGESAVRQVAPGKPLILLRSRSDTRGLPGDNGLWCLTYDPAAPASALDDLCAGLRAALQSRDQADPAVEGAAADVPDDDPVGTVPQEFRDELEQAARCGWRGRVALLGHEAQRTPWAAEGLRLVGREQFKANAFAAAAVTLEDLRRRRPLDREAARLLAAIRDRRGEIPVPATPLRTILFTGHRIDEPGRQQPRFPAGKESAARAAIRAIVAGESAGRGGAVGIAGAASGGDILFHEVCRELGVPTRLFLAVPPAPYIASSVAPAGDRWVERFWAVYDEHPSPPVLSPTGELPQWLRYREPYSVWQRNNLWMLNEALAGGADHATVVALWNGKAGDGPGGTADMIAVARARGADVQVIETADL